MLSDYERGFISATLARLFDAYEMAVNYNGAPRQVARNNLQTAVNDLKQCGINWTPHWDKFDDPKTRVISFSGEHILRLIAECLEAIPVKEKNTKLLAELTQLQSQLR